MAIEIEIKQNGQTVARIPLQEPCTEEIGDEEIRKLVEMYAMGASTNRMRAMLELLRRSDAEMRFTDFITITGNPKLASECAKPMIARGIVTHERRRGYRTPDSGMAMASFMVVAMNRLMKLLDEEECDDDEEI